ncbi:hypothetical protein CkaCkLH20_11227 [Colletotrichum karsti]|uniref:Uncharacterized protein n=1 Tax=Colletotrichum karsti TaxID=1095194 RepID=A0A9P6LFL8_9PEZI|nr:uncharacterized protein CkaCkLH20_11227 [Colletotrichum karsti]KAF9871306.1 hypothetical protein CkaCkLH20_11227 [Colletotrichum karsti]
MSLLSEYYKELHQNRLVEKPDVSRMESLFVKASTMLKRVLMIVDGIDGCSNYGNTIMDLVSSLVSQCQNLSIVMISRPNQYIESSFITWPNPSKLEITTSAEQLKLFTAMELQKRVNCERLASIDPRIKDEALERLSHGNGASFRLIACQIEFLAGSAVSNEWAAFLEEPPQTLESLSLPSQYTWDSMGALALKSSEWTKDYDLFAIVVRAGGQLHDETIEIFRSQYRKRNGRPNDSALVDASAVLDMLAGMAKRGEGEAAAYLKAFKKVISESTEVEEPFPVSEAITDTMLMERMWKAIETDTLSTLKEAYQRCSGHLFEGDSMTRHLDFAVSCSAVSCLDFLLTSYVEQRHDKGRLSEMVLNCSENRMEDVLMCLLGHGAITTTKDNMQRTIWHLSAENEDCGSRILQALLSHVDQTQLERALHMLDSNGQTPLARALQCESHQCVEMMTRHCEEDPTLLQSISPPVNSLIGDIESPGALKKLYEKGLLPKLPGEIPLHCLGRESTADTIRELLDIYPYAEALLWKSPLELYLAATEFHRYDEESLKELISADLSLPPDTSRRHIWAFVCNKIRTIHAYPQQDRVDWGADLVKLLIDSGCLASYEKIFNISGLKEIEYLLNMGNIRVGVKLDPDLVSVLEDVFISTFDSTTDPSFLKSSGMDWKMLKWAAACDSVLPSRVIASAGLLFLGKMDTDNCSIDGNGDLYGLGVRVGVYCQWMSSWIHMLVDEESAEDVHGVNAIFVFAIIIATILAQVHHDVRPIELYIMLQISLGFFMTVLSTIGVRNHFLRPERIELIWHHFRRILEKRKVERLKRERFWTRQRFQEAFEEERASKSPLKALGAALWRMANGFLEDAAAKNYVSNPNFEVPLEYLTPFKPSHISWLGVLWRTSILGIVAGFNVYFWCSVMKTPDIDRGCGSPFIFLFSKQRIHEPVIIFSQIISIIIVILVLPLCLLLTSAAGFLVTLLAFCAVRDIIYFMVPSATRATKVARRVLLPIFERIQYYLRVSEFVLKRTPSLRFLISIIWLFILIIQLLSFFTNLSDPATVRIHAVVRAGISLFTPRHSDTKTHKHLPDATHAMTDASKRRRIRSISRILSIVWNVLVFLSILWFILSIELTLGWNNVQDVNEIKTTGQLIPFIIGCVSTCQVLKQVGLIGLRKLFPDWANYELEAAYTARGGIKFHINHVEPEQEKAIVTSDVQTGQNGSLKNAGSVQSSGFIS